MLSLHNSSWNKIPFKSKHKDKFLLLASDIGKVTHEEEEYEIEYLELFYF
jgi:hypothetical protein